MASVEQENIDQATPGLQRLLPAATSDEGDHWYGETDIEYGLLAGPLEELVPPPTKAYYGERIKSVFGRKGLQISVERLHLATIAALCVALLALVPLVPRLTALMGGQSLAALVPVFQYVTLQKTLEGTIQAGEYACVGAVLAAPVSYAVASWTAQRWVRLGAYVGFGLVLSLLDSLMPPNPLRFVVVRVALLNSALVLLAAPQPAQILWQLVLRVTILSPLCMGVLLLGFGLLAPAPSQAQLPWQLAHLLGTAAKQLEHATAQLCHAASYARLPGRPGSGQRQEAWRVLHCARGLDRRSLVQLGGDARGRALFAEGLLGDARRQRFANVPLLQLYTTVLQRIEAIADAETLMRTAVSHRFAHILEPELTAAVHSAVHPLAALLQARLRLVAARLQFRVAALAPVPPAEPLAEAAAVMKQQYLAAMARQLADLGLQAGTVAQTHMFALALVTVAYELAQLERMDWAELARIQPSPLRLRVHLFFSAIAAPVVDLIDLLWADVLLRSWRCLVGAVRCAGEGVTRDRLRRLAKAAWEFGKSNRWHFAFRLMASLGVLQAVLFLLTDVWPQYKRHSSWVLLTALLVSQPTLGSTVARGLHRLIGTALAGAVGYLVVSVILAIHVPHIWRAVIKEAFTVPIAAVCAYFWQHSRQPYLWAVVMITYLLIVFGSVPDVTSAFAFAVGRTVSIIIGILWAFLASALLLPHRAHHDLIESVCATVEAVFMAGTWVRRSSIRWIVEADEDTEAQRHARTVEELRTSEAELRSMQRQLTLQQLLSGGYAVPRPAQKRTAELVRGRLAPPDTASEAQAKLLALTSALRLQIRAQEALLLDVSKERWRPPRLPTELQPFFARALVLFECASLVLREDPPPALQGLLAQHMAEAATVLNRSVRHTAQFLCASLRRQPAARPNFTGPAFAMHQFTKSLDQFLDGLPRPLAQEHLEALLMLCARAALIRDVMREWQAALDLVAITE